MDIDRTPTGSQYAISFSVRPADTLPHLAQNYFLHHREHWSSFIARPTQQLVEFNEHCIILP